MADATTPIGLQDLLAGQVADAMRDIPEMEAAAEQEFLEMASDATQDLFWGRYIADLPKEARQEMENVLRNRSEAEAEAWRVKYANFQEDPKALEQMLRVMDELQAEFPAIVKEQHAKFCKAKGISIPPSVDVA